MLKKVKIVISLDKSTQSHIFSKTRNLQENVLGKWLKPEKYHIQIAMMRMVDDEYLIELCELLTQELEELKAFDLELDKLVWGPKRESPKMIWLKGEQSEELVSLRNVVERCLNENPRPVSNFSPHITLAKVPKKGYSDEIDLDKIKTSIVLSVDSVDVIEISSEGRSKSEVLLQRIPLSY